MCAILQTKRNGGRQKIHRQVVKGGPSKCYGSSARKGELREERSPKPQARGRGSGPRTRAVPSFKGGKEEGGNKKDPSP